MSGNRDLLIPAIAMTLMVLARPITREGFRKGNAIASSSGSREYYSTSISSYLCDLWVVLSSVVALYVWATCDLNFDGIEVLSAASSSSVAEEKEESNVACREGNSGSICDDDHPLSRIVDLSVNRHSHPSVDQVSNAISEHCWTAAFIIGTAMILELLQVIAHRMVARRNRVIQRRRRLKQPREERQQRGYDANNTIYTLFGWHDSECLLVVYALLFLTHVLMANDRAGETFGLVFAEPMAAANGYYRPVSTIRYIEWAIASPMCMSLIGRSIPRLERDSNGNSGSSDVSSSNSNSSSSNSSSGGSTELSDTLRPALVITVSYVFSSWLALVIIDPTWRHALIFVSFVGYTLSAIDQLTSWKIRADENAVCARAYDALLSVQILVYAAYGLVYLLALNGLIDAVSEQAALTYADATIKLTVSASLAAMRYADSLAEALRERTKADAIASDLRQIIRDANAPIFALDAEGHVSLWNNKLGELTGATLADVEGKPLVNYLSEETRVEFREVFEARKRGKMGSEHYQCDIIHVVSRRDDEGEGGRGGSDGERCYRDDDDDDDGGGRIATLMMTATARHDAEGRFMGIVGIGSDLTEVTRIRAVEEKKNQFMAVVSHELKSPLHGIIGLSEALSHGEKSADRKARLKMVKSCAIRLLDLVSNIMQMSRLTRDQNLADGPDASGGCGDCDAFGGNAKETIRRDPVDIPSVVNEVCVLVTNATDKGNCPLLNPLVKFENKLGSDVRLPIVEGDAYKITQVFYNILTNACKFCTHGSITVDAGINNARDKLEVSITDTGVGINPESVKRIFEPFEQESNSSRRNFGGIGLGLAISKQVIKLHGGDVFVTSTPGKGSQFVISLPVTEEAVALWASSSPPPTDEKNCSLSEAEHFQESATISTAITTGPRSVGSKRYLQRKESGGGGGSKPIILSVDDDIVNQEVIRSALSDNYVLHVAMNGFEALEYFSTRSKLPDLVLLDLMMPGMDGFEVLKEIRENKKISPTNLPVIMLSAMEPVDKALIQSLKDGANDYVSKPFDPEILKARVGTAVEIRRLRQFEGESFHYFKLLHDILPDHIVDRLILGDSNISERHESVCMLFSDIVGWTPMSESIPTQQLIELLNQLFSEFDKLTEKHGVFKADTIGDAYIVAAGHEGQAGSLDATLRVCEFAIDMLEVVKSIKPPNGVQLQIRVGIHTGPAYSGVVGSKVPKFTFFGDTVNTAARLEQSSVPGCINMSNSCRQALAREISRSGRSLEGWLSHMGASIVRRDPVKIKGKGAMELFFLCPKGMSSQLAIRLSKSNMQERASTSESMLNVSEVSFEPGDFRVREDRLKGEVSRLEASNQEAWAEVETLRLNLAESTAIMSRYKINRERYQPRRNMPHRVSLTSRTSSHSSRPPLDAPSHLQQIEELKIQLLVTTNSLTRARQALTDKDNQIDEMELQQLRIQSQQLSDGARDGLHGSIVLTSAISPSAHGHRRSFVARTHKLLETFSHDPLITRLPGALDDPDQDFR
mmetsp:Transcript_19500/g.40821  ORF Transcript_19500/g.40821 Transcript_19500/m.40821 type:complete len:1506 (-) Transcript_19500:56-4573(-)